MGYTHYFTQKKDAPLNEWAAFKDAVLRLYDAIPATRESAGNLVAEPLVICDGSGEVALTEASRLFKDDPELGEILVFNGDDREGRNLAHETMLLSAKKPPRESWQDADSDGFQCCKTAYKPYDWFVVAVLLLAAKHCPGVWVLGTDGEPEDWLPVVVWLEANGFGAMKLSAGVKIFPQRD